MEANIQNPEWILSLGRGFCFFSTAAEAPANKGDFYLSNYHEFLGTNEPLLSQVKKFPRAF